MPNILQLFLNIGLIAVLLYLSIQIENAKIIPIYRKQGLQDIAYYNPISLKLFF